MTIMSEKIDFTEIHRLLHIKGYGLHHVPQVTPRMIQHWKEAGVLDETREKRTSGVVDHFNSIEILWISLMKEMRDFGIAIPKIKACKDGFFEQVKTQNSDKYTAFELYIQYILIYDIPIYMVLSNNNEFLLLDDKEFFEQMRSGAIKNAIFFLLNQQIRKTLAFIYETPNYSELSDLSEKEIIALQIIRSGTYKSIKIKQKNGEINMVEGVERIEEAVKISKLLRKGKYQNIEIKQSNGKIVCAHRTMRKKL